MVSGCRVRQRHALWYHAAVHSRHALWCQTAVHTRHTLWCPTWCPGTCTMVSDFNARQRHTLWCPTVTMVSNYDVRLPCMLDMHKGVRLPCTLDMHYGVRLPCTPELCTMVSDCRARQSYALCCSTAMHARAMHCVARLPCTPGLCTAPLRTWNNIMIGCFLKRKC